jgi:CMP-N-acetylneuraminic acid synthetase
MTSILITICARGGSKGIPGKNIRVLNGKPLIGYTIATANAFRKRYPNVDVVLSTDSPEIMEVAAEFGLSSGYRRPEALASDTAGKVDAMADVLAYQEEKENKKYDFLLDLDVTSPLRTVEDLEVALAQLQERKDALNIFSVSPANRNPYFNMVEEQPDGTVDLAKRPEVPFLTRQSAPAVYDMNASFYIFRRKFFSLGERSSITKASLAYVMDHICFDLDHPIDFEVMEFLLSQDKLDFRI